MCYWSIEHSDIQTSKAVVGQRLHVRRRHYGRVNWIIDAAYGAPVCLKDGTEVILDVPQSMQKEYHLPAEAEATFRQVVRMDIFCIKAGPKIRLDQMPHGLKLTVLIVPGQDPITAEEQAVVEALRRDRVDRV
jgi:hypothetical protein